MEATGQQSSRIQHFLWFFLYFFISFVGLRIAIQSFIGGDELGMLHIGLVGAMSGLLASIYEVKFKLKNTLQKIYGVGIILLVVTLINLVFFFI